MTELDDIDGLAAEYVLGTLDAAERRTVAERRASDKALEGAIVAWERRLAPMIENVRPMTPPPALYNKIRAEIGLAQHIVSLKARERALERRAARWRNAFVGVSAVAAALVGVLGYRDYQAEMNPGTKYVAVLTASKDMPPFLLMVDMKTSNCIITAVGAAPVANKIYEVWMLHDSLAKPKSMGVIGEGEMNVMPVEPGPDRDMLMNASFAVSLEPMGGSPTGLPTGPVMYTGRLVKATP
ncbi:MAG: anti-sigma factor [Hyphomicrobium sp.]|nr:anti-sigma factor [Hyphomicrobium sp.]